MYVVLAPAILNNCQLYWHLMNLLFFKSIRNTTRTRTYMNFACARWMRMAHIALELHGEQKIILWFIARDLIMFPLLSYRKREREREKGHYIHQQYSMWYRVLNKWVAHGGECPRGNPLYADWTNGTVFAHLHNWNEIWRNGSTGEKEIESEGKLLDHSQLTTMCTINIFSVVAYQIVLVAMI